MNCFVVSAVCVSAALGVWAKEDALAGYPIRAADIRDVRVTGGLWLDRLETNCTATLRSNLAKCNETPRIANILWGNREPGNELQCWFRER